MRRTFVAFWMLMLVGALAGCQSSTSAKGSPADLKTTAAGTTSGAAAAKSSAPTTAAFGVQHGVTYPDGLVVSVLSAVKFTPSAEAAGMAPGDAAVKLQIRITNNSKTAFDPSLVSVAVHAGPNGDQGSAITDLGNGAGQDVGDGFQGSIPPGQSATAMYGFAVPPADLPNITVLVTPDFDHNDAPFTGVITG